jgi:hypothetical protein
MTIYEPSEDEALGETGSHFMGACELVMATGGWFPQLCGLR